MDYSASYVNYRRSTTTASTGPYKIEVAIYGGQTFSSQQYDCSSYTYDGLPRTKAIVQIFTEGFVRQDVAENFGVGSYGQIRAKRADGQVPGTAVGCWSVDSVGDYNYYNDLA